MRDVELRLIAELMRNSRRSDMDLSVAVGVSQAIITRLRQRLEEDRVIREYTMIPDWGKLGFKIMAITFAFSRALNKEEAEKAKNILAESVKDKQFEFIMLERGRGLGFDAIVISLHEVYASYVKVLEWLRGFGFLDVKKIDSFLIYLEDNVRYRPLTFSTLATNLLLKAEEQDPEG